MIHNLFVLTLSNGALLQRFDGMQMVKMGVQYSLFGGSIVNLGTERHHQKYFDDIDSYRLPGVRVMHAFD